MNAFVTSRGRRFLPLLAMGCVLAVWPNFVRADMLSSRLTDRVSLTPANTDARGATARVVFASQEAEKAKSEDVEHVRNSAVAALALILVVPAGTVAMVAETPTTPPPPPPPPPQPQPSTPTIASDAGTTGGTTTGGSPPPNSHSNPEPGSLVLALTGSGTALLAWLRRRRRKTACGLANDC